MRKAAAVSLITLGVLLAVSSITSLVSLTSKGAALASANDWWSLGTHVFTVVALGALSYTLLKAAKRRW